MSGHSLLFEVIPKLATDEIPRLQGRDGLERFYLLVAEGFGVEPGRRLHRENRKDLEQVILDYVADGAGLLIERAPALDSKVLRHRDLDTLDMVAIPQGFEHCIAETKIHHVMHRTLAEEMVQTEDSAFFKSSEQDAVEFPGRSPIATERFFDNDARPVAAARFSKLLDDHPEVGGRNSEIKNRVLSASEHLTQ